MKINSKRGVVEIESIETRKSRFLMDCGTGW